MKALKLKAFALLITSVLFLTACEPIYFEAQNTTGKQGLTVPTTEDIVTPIITDENISVEVTTTVTEPEILYHANSLMSEKPQYTDAAAVEAKSAICYNLTDDIIIYGKNIHDKVYPASITKLVTALIALENADDGIEIEVGSEIELIESGSSVALLRQGQVLDMKAALTALLIPSGNDAAYSIAVNVANALTDSDVVSHNENLSYFVKLMNTYAKNIGAEDTNFANVDGYHDSNHYSTVYDLLLFSIEASKSKEIVEISSDKEPEVKYISGEVASWGLNRMPLIHDPDYDMRGLKTGFTDDAGYCFSGLCNIDGKEIIAIVTGCEDEEIRENDIKKLLYAAREGHMMDGVEAYVD